MSKILYECYETGVIIEKEYIYPAQFCTEKNYEILYREELPRFRKQPIHIYAVPFFEEPEKLYNGTGRMGLMELDKKKRFLTGEQKKLLKRIENMDWDAEELMLAEKSAIAYLSLFKDSEDYELIWTRISGSDEQIPEGYRFIGYDISYLPFCDGAFSIICDCMFICRWHGCDEEGTLFLEDFQKLNENGLFGDWQSAYAYMVKYLNQDWTERGEYGIFEIYRK